MPSSRRWTCFAAAILLAASLATSAAAHPLDATWSDEFGLPICNGLVYAAVPDSGRLLVLGTFNQIGSVPATRVASWDGNQFVAIGEGLPFPATAAIRYAGSLIAGGDPLSVGDGSCMPTMMRWDGQKWVDFACSFQGVRAFALFGGDLIAAGDLAYVNEVSTGKVARWNGSDWSPLLPVENFNQARTLLTRGDSLWIGGNAAAGRASCLYVWDGASLTVPGAGLQASTSPGQVNSTLDHAGFVYAAGNFTRSGATSLGSTIARFDGTTWQGVGHALGEASGLAVFGGELLAMISTGPGLASPHHLVAGEWVPLGNAKASASSSPFNPAPHLVPFGSRLVMTRVSAVNDTTRTGIASFDGGEWHDAEEPWAANMHGVSGTGDLVAWGGQLLLAGPTRAGTGAGFLALPRLGMWNGSSWTAFPVAPGFAPVSLLVYGADSLVVGGNVTSSLTRVQRWNGSAWAPLQPDIPYYFFDLAMHQGTLWAMGDFENGASSYYRMLVRWNGSGWVSPVDCSILDPSLSLSFVGTLASWRGGLAVGGYGAMGATCLGSVQSSLFLRDSTHWFAPDPNSPEAPYAQQIEALAEFQGDLVAGGAQATGEFRAAIRPVSRWDGSQWHEMSAGALFVNALCVANGRLFAGGGFYRDDSTATWGVAMWDGARWQLIGSGMNGRVQHLATYGGDLYATGSFAWANGKPSFGIARWRGLSLLGAPPPAASPAALRLSAPQPNPARGAQRFAFTLPAASRVRLAIHDVSGRRVATLLDEPRAAGAQAVTWDGTAAGGAPVAPGLYFARLRTDTGDASASVVRVK